MSLFLRRTCAHVVVRAPALRRALTPAQTVSFLSRRSLFTTTAVCRAKPERTDEGAADVGDSGKFDSVGHRLYSLVLYHRKLLNDSGSDSGREMVLQRRVEYDAWTLLQSIPEEAADQLPPSTLVEVVHTYNYFAAFWAHGMEGPETTSAAGQSPSTNDGAAQEGLSVDGPFDYPLAALRPGEAAEGEVAPQRTLSRVEAADVHHTVARANPLDEIVDF